MDYSDFCNICFADNKLHNIRKIGRGKLLEILKSLIEWKDTVQKQKIYLCLDCCKKLKEHKDFKEICVSSMTLYRDLHMRVKTELELQNADNIQTVMQDLVSGFRKNVLSYQISQDNSDLCVNEIPTGCADLGQDIFVGSSRKVVEDCQDNINVTDIVNTSNPADKLPSSFTHLNLSSTIGEYPEESAHGTPCFLSTSHEMLAPNMKQESKNFSENDMNLKIKSELPTYTNQQKRFIPGQEPYKCSICSKCFVNSGYLEKHKQNRHIQKIYKCKMCKLHLTDRNSFILHKRKHTSEKLVLNKHFQQYNCSNHENNQKIEENFMCKICHKIFKQESHLAAHQLSHLNQNLYKCNVCKEDFRESKDLVIHIHTHNILYLYMCNLCNKLFTELSVFNDHMNIHSNNTPQKLT